MEKIFIKSFIPNAKILECSIGKGISCFQNCDSIFVLANATVCGPITLKIKQRADKLLESFGNQIIYVSIYYKKESFLEADKVAWGSYVWFADAPQHTIHFDDNPQTIRPHLANYK